MKSFLKPLCLALLSAFALATSPVAQAQVNVNVGPPSWGPAVPAGAQYYYIPETNGFYDVPARQYVVRRDGRWIRTANLSGYNTANFHPVVVDYVGAQPWSRYDEYHTKYARKGHPHGMPPGQAKKQHRDYDRDRDDDRNRNGDILPGVRIPRVRLPDGRYPDGRRDDDRRDDRRYDDRRYERHDDDDHGKHKDKGKSKKNKD